MISIIEEDRITLSGIVKVYKLKFYWIFMEEKNKKQIVFLEPYSTVMIYKISKILKERGYETVLIRLLEQNKEDNEFYNKAFSRVINMNISHFKISNKSIKNIISIFFSQIKKIKSYFKSMLEILRLKPYVYIGRGKSNWPVALFKIVFFRKTPFIYFPYDIRNQLTLEHNKSIPSFEFKSERYCFEKADGVMHKGGPEELNPEFMNHRFLGNNIKIQKNQLNFHPYCIREFFVPINNNKLSKKDKELHFVYVGGISKATMEFFEGLLDFDWLLKQKIHIHFYFCSNTKDKKNYEKEKETYNKFLEKNKDYPYLRYIHFHKSLNPKELSKEISKYDFGAFGYSTLKNSYLEPRFTTGNKISTYLEAGLPFVYPNEQIFMDKLMKSYNLGLGYSCDNNATMNNIRKILKKFNYRELQKNVLAAREDFLMEKNIPILEEFIKTVVKSTKR